MVGVNEFQLVLPTIWLSFWSHMFVDLAVSLQTFLLLLAMSSPLVSNAHSKAKLSIL